MDKVLIMFGFVAIANFAGADMELFCQEQGEVYEATGSQARRLLMTVGRTPPPGVEIAEICRTLIGYSDTTFDTQATCPGLIQDKASQDVWQNINDLIYNVCPNDHLRLECSPQVVGRLTTHCMEIINHVQVDSEPEQICQTGEAYLGCMENMTVMCSGSSALMAGGVYAGLASVRSTMVGICANWTEGMQGDIASDGTPGVPQHVGCTIDMANREMSQCSHAYVTSRHGHNEDICRAKYMFLECVDLVMVNCQAFQMSNSVDNIRAQFQSECGDSFYTCVPEVLSGSSTMRQFCLNHIGNISQNSVNYCRKMRQLGNCLSRLRDVCPVANDSERQDADILSAGVDEALSTFC